jgi:hypothetical protein
MLFKAIREVPQRHFSKVLNYHLAARHKVDAIAGISGAATKIIMRANCLKSRQGDVASRQIPPDGGFFNAARWPGLSSTSNSFSMSLS